MPLWKDIAHLKNFWKQKMENVNKKFRVILILIILILLVIVAAAIFILQNYSSLPILEDLEIQNEQNKVNLDVFKQPSEKSVEKSAANINFANTNSNSSFVAEPATQIVPIIKLIKYDVPFTSQAPLGEWDDLRQQNACEEAAALMAMKWVRGESIASPEEAKKEILDIVDYQVKRGNFHYDTSTRDTVEIIFKGYFKYDKVKVIENATIDDIKMALVNGSLVVVATNGQLLGNPYYTAPGPAEHMLVVIGYDPKTKEFITNDNGTKRGKNYRYNENVFYNAIRDYPTGYHEPITKIEKLLIVVEK